MLTAPTLELLIIDESQDFDPEWIGALLAQLKAQAKLYVRGSFERSEAVISLAQTTVEALVKLCKPSICSN
jgi:hypothetical protein